MDSGSTSLTILLALSVLVFLGLHGASAAMPLLRRAAVRDSLDERGVREAAVRRLRTNRNAYEGLISLLLLLSAGAASASALALTTRLFDFPWPLVLLVLAGLWIVLLLIAPIPEFFVRRLSVSGLVTLATVAQALLWPFLPVRVFSRSGLRLAGAEADADQPANGHANGGPEPIDVEEEIAEEPLEPHEREMIHAILHLDEPPVREIMIPRVDVISVELSDSVERASTRLLDSGHTRLPVYDGNPDNVVGILYSRDLLAAITSDGGMQARSLRDLMRPPFFVPESKRIHEMIGEFKERRIHMAIVVDEYGGVAGIATIEDLLEEIVGEIEDEFDPRRTLIEWDEDGDALIDARMSIEDFNEQFDVAVAAEGFDTVGGLLFTRFGEIPDVGDAVAVDGLRIRVDSTSGRRIHRVRVTRPTPAP